MTQELDWFEACCYDGDFVWIVPVQCPIFYKYSIQEEKIIQIYQFPDEVGKKTRLFGSVVKYDEKLIFTPVRATCIIIFDLKKEEFKLLQVEREYDGNGEEKDFDFYTSYLYKYELFLFSSSYSKLPIMNLIEESISYDEELSKNIYKLTGKMDFIKTNYSIYNDYLIFTLRNTNNLLEYNYKTKKYRLINIGNITNRYIAPVFDGTYYWMIFNQNNNNIIVRYDPDNNKEMYFCVQDICLKYDYCENYIGSMVSDNYICFFPSRYQKDIIWVRKDSIEIGVNSEEVEKEQRYSFSFVKKFIDKYVAYDVEKKKLFIFNNKGLLQTVQINLNDEYMLYKLKYKFSNVLEKKYIYESSLGVELNDLIKYIGNFGKEVIIKETNERSIGEKIFRNLFDL